MGRRLWGAALVLLALAAAVALRAAALLDGGPEPGPARAAAPRPAGPWVGLDDSPPRPCPRPDEPLDIVLRWVNSSDPHWNRQKALFLGPEHKPDPSRWFDNEELRYAIRSLERFGEALNVRYVWVLATDQTPAWFRPGNPRVRVVQASDLLRPDQLPTFNSNALAVAAAFIPGLAEHYLLWDDDNVLSSPTGRDLWFDQQREEAIFYVERYSAGCGDAFSCSLAHSAALLERDFGRRSRQSSGHLPTIQNRKVLREMQRRWPDEFEATLSHRFRHRDDVNVQLMLPWFMVDAGLGARPEPVRPGLSQVIGVYSKGAGVQNPNFHKISRARTDELFDAAHVVCFNNGDKRLPAFQAYLQDRFPKPSVAEVSSPVSVLLL